MTINEINSALELLLKLREEVAIQDEAYKPMRNRRTRKDVQEKIESVIAEQSGSYLVCDDRGSVLSVFSKETIKQLGLKKNISAFEAGNASTVFGYKFYKIKNAQQNSHPTDIDTKPAQSTIRLHDPKPIFVTNENGKTVKFPSISEAARIIGTRHKAIIKALESVGYLNINNKKYYFNYA